MLDNLNKYKIVLASNSPRRQELLKAMDVNFEVMVKKGIDESYSKTINVHNVPEFLAKKKAEAYRDEITNNNLLLITADTVVICGDEILGKPSNEESAQRMINMLQGNEHTVVSGVALTTKNYQVSFSVSTKVRMNHLTPSQINYYIAKYKPFDKAGAYGIQEWIGIVGIDYIEGSYHNVMGLPTQRLFEELSKL